MEMLFGLVNFLSYTMRKYSHFQTLNQVRRWLMDVETCLMEFIVTREANLISQLIVI